MKKINIILYLIMGLLSLTICVLLVKIANRPRYISNPEPPATIKEITFEEANIISPLVAASSDSSDQTLSDNQASTEDSAQNGSTVSETNNKKGKASTKVNIREIDGDQGRVLKTVEEGYTFEILDIQDNGWVKISFEGGIGYISSKYVIIVNQ